MGTPPGPTISTVFNGVFELFLIEIFGNILLLYRQFIDYVLDLWKICDEERNASELQTFQETMQSWYGLEWTFRFPFLNIDFMDLTIAINENRITTTLFEKTQSILIHPATFGLPTRSHHRDYLWTDSPHHHSIF